MSVLLSLNQIVMLSTALTISTFAFVGAATPGPVNIIASFIGAKRGFKAALPYVFGATISYIIVVLIAGLGLEKLFQYLPVLETLLRYAGTMFLLYLSYKIATSPLEDFSANATNTTDHLFSWRKGFLTQWLNPKAWLFAMSGVSLFVSSSNAYQLYLVLFASISFFVCFIGISLWAGLGQSLKQWLKQDIYQQWFNRIMAILLASTTLSLGWF